jgi:hypothetical protein
MNDLEEQKPCIRGCTYPTPDGEDPRPKPARHGQFCDSCYWRIWHALKVIPDLMANMRLQTVPRDGVDFIPFGSHAKLDGSPLPLRVDPLDACDALFAKLILWTDDIAERLHAKVPSIRVWMGMREVQGMRPVSAASAHDIAAQLSHWFTVRLEDIAKSAVAVEFHDDICWGWDESPGVYKLTGRYGVEPRPLRKAEMRECPVCGQKEVFVKWPDLLNPDIAVMCGRCKWVAEPEKYGHYAKLFAVA